MTTTYPRLNFCSNVGLNYVRNSTRNIFLKNYIFDYDKKTVMQKKIQWVVVLHTIKIEKT